MADILSEIIGRVGWLRVDNPPRRNAMTLQMWRKLPALIADFERNPQVRAIVLTGTGDKAFVSGADISEFAQVRNTPQDVEAYETAVDAAERALRDTLLPTIAAVNGLCYGGGLGLASSCDLRYAASSARFCMPAAKLGLGYGLPGVKAFLELLGPSSLKAIFFTGEPFDATLAAGMGFVNGVFDDDRFHDDVQEVARGIAANAPLTLRALKQAVKAVQEPANAALQKDAQAAIQACFDSADYQEGRLAFSQKRRPDFQGR